MVFLDWVVPPHLLVTAAGGRWRRRSPAPVLKSSERRLLSANS